MPELDALRDSLREFAAERDWEQFHSPKNLAMALCVEAAELMERFQWSTEEQSRHPTAEELAGIREELADVLLYLVRLADQLHIDLLESAQAKILVNASKYPVDKSRGNSRKYTEF